MRRCLYLLLLAAVAHYASPAALAAWQIVLSFDEAAQAGVPPLSVRYSNRGVLLPATAELLALGRAKGLHSRPGSPPNVLIASHSRGGNDRAPFDIEFTGGVESVSLATGVPWNTRGRSVTVTLDAFAADGARVASAQQSAVGPGNVDIPMRVAAKRGGERIRRIRLTAIDTAGVGWVEVVDDLTLGSSDPLPVLARDAPTVRLRSPTQGSTTATGRLAVVGEISGEGLLVGLAPPRVTIATRSPDFDEVIERVELAEGGGLEWALDARGVRLLRVSLDRQLPFTGDSTITLEAYNGAGTGTASAVASYVDPNVYRVAAASSAHAALEHQPRMERKALSPPGPDADREQWRDAVRILLKDGKDVPPRSDATLTFNVTEPTILFVSVTSHGADAGKLSAALSGPGSTGSAWTAGTQPVRDGMALVHGRVPVTAAAVAAGAAWTLRLSSAANGTLFGEVLVVAAATTKPTP